MERVDISNYLREYHELGEIVLRAKWTMDGATSLEEAATFLRRFADELDALAKAGFHLMQPVEDDYAFAHRGDETLQEPVSASGPREQTVRRLHEDLPPAPTTGHPSCARTH